MGTVVQLLERTKPTHASADATRVDAVQMLPRAAADQIVAAVGKCETLSLGIELLRSSLKTLDDIIGLIDDPETREKARRWMKSTDASLLFESERLSRIKCAIHKKVGNGSSMQG